MNILHDTTCKRRSSKNSRAASPEKNVQEHDPTLPQKTPPFPEVVSCHRCGGLMRPEWCYNLHYDAGEMEILTWRCLQCGEMIDPVILRNRQSPAPPVAKKRTRHHPATSLKSLKKKAKAG